MRLLRFFAWITVVCLFVASPLVLLFQGAPSVSAQVGTPLWRMPGLRFAVAQYLSPALRIRPRGSAPT